MQHIFDVDIANEYGLVDAIIFQHIGYWVDFNEANEKNFHDGYYWTYNSIKAFEKQFPYLSTKKIRGALERLENNELIISGEFNEMGYDRTKWYTLSQKGKCIMPKGQMELAKRANALCQKGEPIPYIKPYIETNNINILSKDNIRSTPNEVQQVIDAWNALGLSKINKIVDGTIRYKYLKKRIKDYGFDEVLRAIENVRNSEFLQNATFFSFDWMIKPNNFPKVLEGNYSNKDNASETSINISSNERQG